MADERIYIVCRGCNEREILVKSLGSHYYAKPGWGAHIAEFMDKHINLCAVYNPLVDPNPHAMRGLGHAFSIMSETELVDAVPVSAEDENKALRQALSDILDNFEPLKVEIPGFINATAFGTTVFNHETNQVMPVAVPHKLAVALERAHTLIKGKPDA